MSLRASPRALASIMGPAICLTLGFGAAACGDTDAVPADAGTDSGDTGVDVDTGPSGTPLDFRALTFEGDRLAVTELRFVPGSDDELVVLEKDGILAHYRLDGDTARLLGETELSGVYTDQDCGLISLAFDPDFANNDLIYVAMCTSEQFSGVYRYTLDLDDLDGLDATRAEIISLGDETADRPWHNVGSLAFDEDGVLWVPFGEKNRGRHGQDTSDPLGALLRIIPSRVAGAGGYTIPDDNPFVGLPGRAEEIWAYGLRSPWRGILDHRGWYWIGDVGADDYEELNLITQAGQNFGWNLAEGPCEGDCDGLRDPIASYVHTDVHEYFLDDTELAAVGARSIWVGAEYRDLGNDRYDGLLTDRVLFGDFCLGFVRAIGVDDTGAVVEDVHMGHVEQVSSMAQGPDGYLYATTFGTCTTQSSVTPTSRLFRVVPGQ